MSYRDPVIETHTVPTLANTVRASDYGGSHLVHTPSRKAFKKAIKAQRVWIDGRIAHSSTLLKGGERIVIMQKVDHAPIYKKRVPVLYEDDHLAIVNKPAGLITSGNMKATLQHSLLYNLKESQAKDALPCPRILHRLDKGASGLLLSAKTHGAQQHLNHQLRLHEVRKRYRIITYGLVKKSDNIDTPIDGRSAHTYYNPVKHIESTKYGGFTHVDVEIKEGRTHQIRKHMASVGHSIVGDRVYGGDIHPGRGLYLCCTYIQCIHPITNEEITISMALPKKFVEFPQ